MNESRRFRISIAGLLAVLVLACRPGMAADAACASAAMPVTQQAVDFTHADGRVSRVTLWYPSRPGAYPRVLFSHGARSAPLRYEALLRRIAASGRVVVAPLHLDSELLAHATAPTREAVWQTRKQDALALVRAAAIAPALPAQVRLQDTPALLVGHSFGAFTVQVLAGAVAVGEAPLAGVPPVAGLVALSPPGPLPGFIDAGAWSALASPQLVLTGTADVFPGFADQWQVHAAAHHGAVAGEQWLWVGQGVDHYFGRLIGRLDRDEVPQAAAFAEALDTVLAFMDRYAPVGHEGCDAGLVEGRTPLATVTRR